MMGEEPAVDACNNESPLKMRTRSATYRMQSGVPHNNFWEKDSSNCSEPAMKKAKTDIDGAEQRQLATQLNGHLHCEEEDSPIQLDSRDDCSDRLSINDGEVDGDVKLEIGGELDGDEEGAEALSAGNAAALGNAVNYFTCSQCNKFFWTENSMRHHFSIYHSDKAFVCEICGKAFRFRSNLAEHRSVHTSLKPYVCKYCGKSSRLKGNLTKHILKHHKMETNAVVGKEDIIIKKGKKSIKDPKCIDFLEKSMIILTADETTARQMAGRAPREHRSAAPPTAPATPVSAAQQPQQQHGKHSSWVKLSAAGDSKKDILLQHLVPTAATPAVRSPLQSSQIKQQLSSAASASPSRQLHNVSLQRSVDAIIESALASSNMPKSSNSIRSVSSGSKQSNDGQLLDCLGRLPVERAQHNNISAVSLMENLSDQDQEYYAVSSQLLSPDPGLSALLQRKVQSNCVTDASLLHVSDHDGDDEMEESGGEYEHFGMDPISAIDNQLSSLMNVGNDIGNVTISAAQVLSTLATRAQTQGTKCLVCGKHFRKPSNLEHHLRAKHGHTASLIDQNDFEQQQQTTSAAKNSVKWPLNRSNASTLIPACSKSSAAVDVDSSSSSSRQPHTNHVNLSQFADKLNTLSGCQRDIQEIKQLLNSIKQVSSNMGSSGSSKVESLLTTLDARVGRVEKQMEASLSTLGTLIQVQTSLNLALSQFRQEIMQKVTAIGEYLKSPATMLINDDDSVAD